MARGAIRLVFWSLVLAGVFVLGIGYGRTLSGEDELREDKVTMSLPRDAIVATLPTRTVTVTKTVPAQRGTTRGPGSARNATNSQGE